MPGLKGIKTAVATQKKSLDNFTATMERRQLEREPETVAIAPRLQRAEKTSNIPSLYANLFDKKVGRVTRAKYESGKLPRAHKELFEEIKSALEGRVEAVINLTPILGKLDLSRSQTQIVLSCLEAYGYVQLSRAISRTGQELKQIVFKVLK